MSVYLDGLELDFVIDEWESIEEQEVLINQFLNNEAEMDTSLWIKYPRTLVFVCCEENEDKWTIEKSAKKCTSINLVDGAITYTVWIRKIASTWRGVENHEKPWRMEITFIILG